MLQQVNAYGARLEKLFDIVVKSKDDTHALRKDVAILKHQLAGSVDVSEKLRILDRKVESLNVTVNTLQVKGIYNYNSLYTIPIILLHLDDIAG